MSAGELCPFCRAVPIFAGDDGICDTCVREEWAGRVADPLLVQGRLAFYLGALDADRIDEQSARALIQMMELTTARLAEQLLALSLLEADDD